MSWCVNDVSGTAATAISKRIPDRTNLSRVIDRLQTFQRQRKVRTNTQKKDSHKLDQKGGDVRLYRDLLPSSPLGSRGCIFPASVRRRCLGSVASCVPTRSPRPHRIATARCCVASPNRFCCFAPACRCCIGRRPARTGHYSKGRQ
jgi:hypothetical protein